MRIWRGIYCTSLLQTKLNCKRRVKKKKKKKKKRGWLSAVEIGEKRTNRREIVMDLWGV
jgi:hypothetical protein